MTITSLLDKVEQDRLGLSSQENELCSDLID
jgi:hypothetical protein